METLIYTVLATIVVGVILYLLVNLKTKRVYEKIPNTTLDLHINYIEPKPEQLKEPKSSGKDDLKLIKGIGKVVEGVLNENGIYHFEQIANWTDKDIEWMNNNVIFFPKKIEREDWRGQAKRLIES